jgi:flagellar biosynthetic protein FliO
MKLPARPLIRFMAPLLPAIAAAQDTTRTIQPPPGVPSAPGLASILIKLFLSLIIIIGLIYLFVYLLKKISGRTLPAGDNMIKVIGKTYLTAKQSLFVVKLGLSYAVLGVSENSVNLIKELTTEEAQSLQAQSEKPKGFQQVLKSVLKK